MAPAADAATEEEAEERQQIHEQQRKEYEQEQERKAKEGKQQFEREQKEHEPNAPGEKSCIKRAFPSSTAF